MAESAKAPRQTDRTRSKALDVLQEDLQNVRALLARFESSRSSAEKRSIVDEICITLMLQSQLEEEILYPTLVRVLHDDLLARLRHEQTALRGLIEDVQGTDLDARYALSMRLISDYLDSHLDAQDRILPRRSSARIDMGSLGAQLAQRKRELRDQREDFGGWD